VSVVMKALCLKIHLPERNPYWERPLVNRSVQTKLEMCDELDL
jgi:hypothetical protein